MFTMANSLCKISSIDTCILELVKLSVERKSSAIAVRFNPKTRKIQVVDNGIGFSKYELSRICNNRSKSISSQRTIFDQIISLSNAIIITSRSEFSSHTFVKAISANNRSKFFEGYRRPSKGTTITIYNFNSSEWNNSDDRNCSILYVIASIAFTELEISFSIRNDDQQKMLLDIKNPHSCWDILKFFKNNKIIADEESINFEKEHSCASSLSVQSSSLSNDQVHITNNNDILSVLSEWSDWSYKPESIYNINNVYSPLSEWSNWSYKLQNININGNSNNKLFSNAFQMNNLDNNFINLSQMSIWSDWSYHPETSTTINEKTTDSHNIFLPISIYRRLPRKYLNLLRNKDIIECSQSVSLNITDTALRIAIQETAKNLQNLKHKLDECRISKNTICSLEILRQFNSEFIVAITNDNGKKFLIIIDQHAVHERIRYEWLIETYRDKDSYKYFSVKLVKDLLVPDIDENLLNIIAANKVVLNRVGIHIKSIINSTTCIVDAVPKCFLKRIKGYKKEFNLYRLTKNVRQLIMEVANGLSISRSVLPPILPITINNVIASEACHEAIKFGDPLNIKECILLMQALQDTKAPTRCAHGRPSIIPLMDLSCIEKRKFATKVCIYFFNYLYRCYKELLYLTL